MSILVVPPVTPQCVSLSHVWPGRMHWTSPDGRCDVVFDSGEFEFHITAPLDYDQAIIKMVVDKAYAMGLEPVDDLDGEVFLEDGRLRVYLQPVDVVSDTAIPVISISVSGGAA